MGVAEGRGRVHNCPVSARRHEAELCDGELMALIGRQQMALTNATSSYRFQPYYSFARIAPITPMAARPAVTAQAELKRGWSRLGLSDDYFRQDCPTFVFGKVVATKSSARFVHGSNTPSATRYMPGSTSSGISA